MPETHQAHHRRQFLKHAALGSALFVNSLSKVIGSEAATVQNPYQNVDWEVVQRVGSGTHMHCRSQRVLEQIHRRGITHAAISNYYPSVPCTLEERVNQYRVSQNFATVAGEGYVQRKFEWNRIMTDPETGWVDELSEDLKSSFPFKVGPRIFGELPKDIMICPNAEHHSLTDSGCHFNTPGSLFRSGNFDVRGKYQLNKHGYPIGVGLPWRQAFEMALEKLQFPEGGGITVNHPVWSRLKLDAILQMLDFDPRVLGIEIWNQTCMQLNQKGWALKEWDEILKTGRRCWGFAVSDHVQSVDPNFRGFHQLLIPESTSTESLPRACLEAYRSGCFYCTLTGELKFNRIEAQDHLLHVQTDQNSVIDLITAEGTVITQEGTELTWKVPQESGTRKRHLYVRVEARSVDGDDRLFSQPIRLSS